MRRAPLCADSDNLWHPEMMIMMARTLIAFVSNDTKTLYSDHKNGELERRVAMAVPLPTSEGSSPSPVHQLEKCHQYKKVTMQLKNRIEESRRERGI
jgi:hypothetical protein